MRRARALWPLVIATLLAVGVAVPLQAQLISPGRLSQAHSSLEGVSNCTQCHDLGRQGVSNTKCLQCHTLLRDRIQAREGLHATYGNRNCAACHKDHFGTEFELVRFDTTDFNDGERASSPAMFPCLSTVICLPASLSAS